MKRCGPLLLVSTFFAGSLLAAAQDGSLTVRNSASLSIGNYKLDMLVQGVAGLKEFSVSEDAVFGRRFEGEKGYNAPAVGFLDQQWKVAIGAVNGKVYKVALYFEAEQKETAIDVSVQVMQYLERRIGHPTSQQETVYTWDKSDGNVVMQLGKVGTTYMINLFQTSRIVRAFAPKR